MFVQAYWRLYHGDQGYETRHVLVAPLRFPAGSTADASRLLAESALTRVAGLPGVLSVARSNEVPSPAAGPLRPEWPAAAWKRRAA